MHNNKISSNNIEERVSVRKDILDTFEIFMTMPHLGSQKITISDLSLQGISFISDPGMHIKKGTSFESYLHLNKSIRIPLKIKIVHLIDEFGYTRAGCEIHDTDSSGYKAYSNFFQLLISLNELKDI